ncbi:MAG: glycosyltransferase [Naasia sp.]
MGIQTSLDAVMNAERIVDAMRLADDLAFEASRDPGPRTLRVLGSAIRGHDSVAAIASVHALATIQDEEASRQLSLLLSDSRPFIREHAAWALGTRLPRFDAVARLIGMVVDGGFPGMLAQRTLEQWAGGAADHLAVALESSLIGVRRPGARSRVVETLGLVRTRAALRRLLTLVLDETEDDRVRVTAAAALGQRPGERAVEAALLELSLGDDALADVARMSLLDLGSGADAPLQEAREGLTVAQLFLHADIDAELSAAGAGDNGGIAPLLVRLGDALVARSLPDGGKVDRVLTMSRGAVTEASSDLVRLRDDATGHVYGRVPLLREPLPSAKAWPLRVAARRGIRRVLRAAGQVDAMHLRMADVGSLAAADVARELEIPVVFTVAPDPHAVIQSLDVSGRLTRQDFGDVDGVEHFWFRCHLVQQLAANAAHTVLFPRPNLRRDMRELVGIDITSRPERHTIGPEGVDLEVIDTAVAEAAAHAAGGDPGPALTELRALVEGLAPERRTLPIIASVGRLHRVKGMATLVEAWSSGPLKDRANLLIIGGDLDTPSADEREQLALIDSLVDPTQRAAAGLLLPGHRRNDVSARWVAAVRAGLPGLSAPQGIYACASLKEEFGIALLEAMASGLLVVAPDGGGPATYVAEGATGFLTSTWDADRLAEAMASALDASLAEKGDRRAQRSHRTVQKSFTIQRMAEALGGVYAGVALEERELRDSSLVR